MKTPKLVLKVNTYGLTGQHCTSVQVKILKNKLTKQYTFTFILLKHCKSFSLHQNVFTLNVFNTCKEHVLTTIKHHNVEANQCKDTKKTFLFGPYVLLMS